MLEMLLSVVALVSLDKATIFVEHPEISIQAPVVIGKPSTPTPEGIYLLEKATHAKLGRLLVFRREDNAVWAIHVNLPSRKKALDSESNADNYLSAGCIGVTPEVMNKLWNQKQQIILQVY